MNAPVRILNDGREGLLTDDHRLCCEGQPVVIIEGKAHGVADFPDGRLELTEDSEEGKALLDRWNQGLKAWLRLGGRETSF